jgi:hypothetical protein
MRTHLSTANIFSENQRVHEVTSYVRQLSTKTVYILLRDTLLTPEKYSEQFYQLFIKQLQDKPMKEAISQSIAQISELYPSVSVGFIAVENNNMWVSTSFGIAAVILRGGRFGILKTGDTTDHSVLSGEIIPTDVVALVSQEVLSEKDTLSLVMRQRFPDGHSATMLPIGFAVLYRMTGDDALTDILEDKNNVHEDNDKESIADDIAVPVHKNKLIESSQSLFGRLTTSFGKKPLVTEAIPEPTTIALGNPVVGRPLVPLGVGLVCVSLLIGSIVWGVQKKKEKDIQNEYQVKVTQAEKQLDEAIELSSLYPDRARELFSIVDQQVLGLSTSTVKDESFDALSTKVDQYKKNILKEYDLGLAQFVDLSLLSADFMASNILYEDDTLYVWDKQNGKLARIGVSSKRSEILAGPQLLMGKTGIMIYTNRVFIAGNDGVSELGESGMLTNYPIYDDTLAIAYASNFYLLETGKSLYRISPTSDGVYSEPIDWVSPDYNVDLSAPKDFQIDGAVWILTEAGEIIKMTNGIQQPFRLTGIAPTLGGVSDIFANEETEYLYILEKGTGRVIVVTKEGKFVGQYVDSQMAESVMIAVSETERKLFYLTKDKIYAGDLGHLETD